MGSSLIGEVFHRRKGPKVGRFILCVLSCFAFIAGTSLCYIAFVVGPDVERAPNDWMYMGLFGLLLSVIASARAIWPYAHEDDGPTIYPEGYITPKERVHLARERRNESKNS